MKILIDRQYKVKDTTDFVLASIALFNVPINDAQQESVNDFDTNYPLSNLSI